jgi:sensor domain CHASE-containing protein
MKAHLLIIISLVFLVVSHSDQKAKFDWLKKQLQDIEHKIEETQTKLEALLIKNQDQLNTLQNKLKTMENNSNRNIIPWDLLQALLDKGWSGWKTLVDIFISGI